MTQIKQLNNMPPDIIRDVMQFLFTAQPEMVCPPNTRPKAETVALAIALIKEEVNKELLPNLEHLKDVGYSQEIMGKILDDCVDSVYVIAWTAIALSLPFNAAWHEVQAANMAKFPVCPQCKGTGVMAFDNSNGEENPTPAPCNIQSTGMREIDGEQHAIITNCSMGRLITRRQSNGKVVKPKGWTAPDINAVLFEVWNNIYLQQNPDVLKLPRG
jgi:hypothetical protein